ncbi:hypothetical protein HXY33_05555 [Candidatus Bathyarchaeota archaeon]|nr:hypothetical protein [Candidatus Bathyarchaeota archaeon]
MHRKMFIGVALIVVALSIPFLPAAHAATEDGTPSISDTDMQIFNTFIVEIEPDSDASIIYTDSNLGSGSALLSEQILGLESLSAQYVDDPPVVPIESNEIDSLTMPDPVSMYASVFNVTVFNFDYSAGSSNGRVTSLRFEVNKEDHRMVAISVVSECGEPILSFLHYESSTIDILEGFGDMVRINGPHTLAKNYMHLSNVMQYASRNIYAGSNNRYYAALETAYLQMADYSQLIAHELEVNPALSSFNKETSTSLTLLMDPTASGSPNWWARWAIKTAIYLSLVYAVYYIWSLFANPSAGVIVLAAVVAALYAFGNIVLGMAVDIITFGLRVWAPSWGWFWWIPETLAWLIENAGVLLFGGVVLAVKPVVYGASWLAGLFFVSIWLFVDYLVEYVLDYYWLFRDY